MSSQTPSSTRDRYLRRRYGITQAEYDAMLAHYGGVCWACGNPPKEGKNLHVDHNHRTRQVRSLLCWPCNQLLRSYATTERLIGLAGVSSHGEETVARLLGHNGDCAPARRKKRKNNG